MRSSRTINSQGRQKSCAECVKAKRRCDLRQPECIRCYKQRLTCSYPPQPLSRSTETQDNTSKALNNIGIQGNFINTEGAEALIFNHDNTNINGALISASNTELLDFDLLAGINPLAFLESSLHNSSNHDDQIAPRRSLEKWFDETHLDPSIKPRLEYTIKQLKLVPKMMVNSNETPWGHPMLYDEYMPRNLQDAHAACALYIAKNDVNAVFVARHITVRAEELMRSSVPTCPIDLLARAHALILYQLMLTFHDQLPCYGQAEVLLPCMNEIGGSLLTCASQQIDPTGCLPLYPSAAARSAWSSYILRESMRRTVLSIFQLIGLCRLLRGQLEPCQHALAQGIRVTLSAHLWHARNALDFAVAWNEKNHFLVKELEFTSVLRDAMPDDLDTFARMILVSLYGIDDIKGWFYVRGGSL